jgi:hypothetical protein
LWCGVQAYFFRLFPGRDQGVLLQFCGIRNWSQTSWVYTRKTHFLDYFVQKMTNFVGYKITGGGWAKPFAGSTFLVWSVSLVNWLFENMFEIWINNLENWLHWGNAGQQSSYMEYHACFHSLTRGVSHCGLAIYIKKSISRQKKNYENSNISPCKNIIFKKSSKRNQNPSRYENSITNLKFQHKPKYHLSKILI